MTIPLIIAAFGTSTTARATYDHLDHHIRQHFPDHPRHWAYSSRIIKDRNKATESAHRPQEILQQLSSQGHRWAVVQSLHLLGGHEFYRLTDDARQQQGIRTSIGLPLLSSPSDYQRVGRCLSPLMAAHPDSALLLVGHGTDHPCWASYLALQQILRQQMGPRVFVGVTEEYPAQPQLAGEIAAAGFKKVFLIPLLLIAGMHFLRDVTGTRADCWQRQLEDAGLTVDILDHGIGMMPGIGDIFCDHIRAALDTIP